MSLTSHSAKFELLDALAIHESLLERLSSHDAVPVLSAAQAVVRLGRLEGLLGKKEAQEWVTRLLAAHGRPEGSIVDWTSQVGRKAPNVSEQAIEAVASCGLQKLGPLVLLSIEVYSTFVALRWISKSTRSGHRGAEIALKVASKSYLPYLAHASDDELRIIRGQSLYDAVISPPTGEVRLQLDKHSALVLL